MRMKPTPPDGASLGILDPPPRPSALPSPPCLPSLTNTHKHTQTHTLSAPLRFAYLDLIYVVVLFMVPMTACGYCLVDPTAPTRTKIIEAANVILTDGIVAVATLVYCFWLMPLFYSNPSAWFQMVWVSIVHPTYFEITTGYMLRRALARHVAEGRTDVTYLLSILHGMVHNVVLTTSIKGSLDSLR